MLTDLNFVFGLMLGAVLGIIIMILAALENGSRNSVEENHQPQETDKNPKILPFIRIYQKSLSKNNGELRKEEVNQWKDKIEGFQLRNGFYQR